MCVYVHMNVCVHVCTYVAMCMWRLEGNLGYCSLGAVHLLLEAGSLAGLEIAKMVREACQEALAGIRLSLPTQEWGYRCTSLNLHLFLIRLLVCERRSLCFPDKHFINFNVSLASSKFSQMGSWHHLGKGYRGKPWALSICRCTIERWPYFSPCCISRL